MKDDKKSDNEEKKEEQPKKVKKIKPFTFNMDFFINGLKCIVNRYAEITPSHPNPSESPGYFDYLRNLLYDTMGITHEQFNNYYIDDLLTTVKEFKEDSKRGKKSREAGIKGRLTQQGKDRNTDEYYNEIQDYINKLAKNNPTIKPMEIYRKIATGFHLTTRTKMNQSPVKQP